jgi:diguanylate cyclase (GGDEF)-like protein
MNKTAGKYLKTKYFLYIFAPFFILTFIFFMVIRNSSIKNEIDQIKISEKISLESVHEIVLNDLSSVTSDILYLSQNISLYKNLEKSSLDFNETAEEYLNFIKYKKIYDQIRYIDNLGLEKIRVNYDSGNPIIVEKSELQNKEDRYYFKNSIKLNKGEIFMSYFDLNVEDKKIELPYKPVLRFATPVFDKSGKKQGIVIVNYLGKNIINDIRKNSDLNNSNSYSMINSSSYYLLHQDKNKEWGFMFDEKKSINMINDKPKLWEDIKNNKSGQLFLANSLFTYIKINPTENEYILFTKTQDNIQSKTSQEYRWVILSTIPKEHFIKIKSEINQRLLWKLCTISIFIAFVSSLYSKSKYSEYLGLEMIKEKNSELTEKNREIEIQKETLKKMNSYLEEKNEQLFLHSTVDPLTKTYSRRYFSELFSKELTKSKRHPLPLCCIIFDIDHFKKINDNYGHLAGDYILQAISKVIHGKIRNEDIFGRYGGDEFLIALPETDLKAGVIVAEKIRKTISEETFIFSETGIKVTLSMGISAVDDSVDTTEAVINNSDSALYVAKRKGRNRVEIYHRS